MKEYCKINTFFKRDLSHKRKPIIIGSWSMPEFELLQNIEWQFTEKVDGTNIRVMWDGTNVTFGGRTDNAQIPATLIQVLVKTFTPELLKSCFVSEDGGTNWDVELFGEGYGAKIQSGGKYIPDAVDFVLFDVTVGGLWLSRENIEDVAAKLGIRVVPVIHCGNIASGLVLVTDGLKSTWGDFIAEGLVARPKTELLTRHGERIIGKIKHRDFIKE